MHATIARRHRSCVLSCVLRRRPPPAAAFGLAAQAERYLGMTAAQLGLPRSLWCADFMNMLLGRTGASRQALDYRSYGTPAAPGCTDCIAVLISRRWHVGVVKGYDANGNPIIISGNHGHIVNVGTYQKWRVKFYRTP